MEKEAQKMEKVNILRHFSHEIHPLILTKWTEISDRVCSGCVEGISLLYDDEPYCYSCEECDYHLHKRCAEAPLSIHHPSHQHHPLRLLLDKPPYYKDDIVCKACCKSYWVGFTYHCSTCKFDIDLLCGISAERKEFRHFSHLQHPLLLKNLPPQIIRPNKQDHSIEDGDSDGELGDGANDINRGLLDHICKGCNQQISLYDEPYCYRCDRCNYDLHKVCAKAPLSIQHPLHQLHPLQLFHDRKFLDSEERVRYNDCCRREWKGFYYYCFTCDFSVDIICATAGERKVYNPHHNHLLSLVRNPLSAHCNACGIIDKQATSFFQCTTCVEFWLHKDCALLLEKFDYYGHRHKLTIAYGLIEEHAQHDPVCRICKIEIDWKLWIYSCERCRYFVHIACTMKEPTPQLEDGNLSAPEDDGSPVLELPLGDEFHSIMERLMSLNYDKFAINSLVHDHPLILVHDHLQEDGKLRDDDKKNMEEPARKYNMNPMERNKLLCNACVRPIGEIPFYRCGGTTQQQQQQQQKCCKDFFLHKHCAELPNELPNSLFHDIDRHPLVLLPNVPVLFGVFQCQICHLLSNGFAYGCVQCHYYIDVRCAFMPMSIKHGAHPEHVLHLRKHITNRVLINELTKKGYREQINADGDQQRCSGCRGWPFKWTFRCDKCNFKFRLCVRCALSPKTMRHKYDCHPLQLMYLPPEDHISQYFCDICEYENEIGPDSWFYHCADCDQQMHMRCSTSGIGYEIKWGGFITVDHHPHRLTLTECWTWTESDFRCDDCGRVISPIGFRCVQCCKYYLCRRCASRKLTQN